MKKVLTTTLTAALLAPLTMAAQADSTLSEAISNVNADYSFRYRYEMVDQDKIEKKAQASTLKSRATFTTDSYKGFTGKLEIDNVAVIGGELYKSLSNDVSDRPVVADPVGTDINQFYIKYKNDDLAVTTGRQRILLADQRFVGGVGWRQNEQTYDAIRINDVNLAGIKFDYAYIDTVQRIFGPEDSVQPTKFESDSHLLTIDYALSKTQKLSTFAYLLDFENAAALSSNTYGVSYKGTFKPITIAATYASQSDAGDNPTSYDADYLKLELSTKVKVADSKVLFALGSETLGSDDGNKSFTTPLATLHKFQGWTDKFLVTPKDGIVDNYVKVATKIGKVKTAIFYHDYAADEGDADYGTELNFVATTPINKYLKAQLKYASYSADDFSVDTDKLWLSLMAKI